MVTALSPESSPVAERSNPEPKPAAAVIGVVGLGYVGLPLAVEFGKAFRTIGFDLS